eukprot:274232-Prorocentrum_minimum.AAC.1
MTQLLALSGQLHHPPLPGRHCPLDCFHLPGEHLVASAGGVHRGSGHAPSDSRLGEQQPSGAAAE